MNNKVDKLFKEKLEAHNLQPSAQAWEKVESHLSKKNKMVVWLRVAAAIVLLGAAALVAIEFNTPKKQIVDQEEIKPQETPVETPTIVPEQKKQEPGKQVAKKSQAPVRKKAETIEPTPEPQVAVVEEQPVQVPLAVEEVAPQEVVKQEKAIKLVYSLPAIKKPEQAVEPVVAEVKKTGLERVLEIAKEVKNADNPLGELREAKDDILAFEFKKDKDKNKKHN